MTSDAERVVVCGLEGLGLRIVEELRRLDVAVTVVAREPTEERAAIARGLGAETIIGERRDEAVLRAAGVASATAIVLTDDDDVGNVHAALIAAELNPAIRTVIRAYNQDLGAHLAPLLGDARLLSASAIAAPVFVAAALAQAWEHEVGVAGLRFAVRDARPSDPEVVLPLVGASGGPGEVLFPDGPEEAICLMRLDEPEGSTADVASPPPPFRARALNVDRRLARLAAILVAVVALSMVVFGVFADLSPVDALYFAVTVITTTGFGDINLRDAAPALKVYAVLLMLAGAATLALFYAVIADIVVGARLARALGGIPRGIAGHVVVCGLGSVGYRIVQQIAARGVPVIGVELHDGGPFVAAARRDGVPILIGDAAQRETLRSVLIARARCLIAATDDDIANLVAALNAKGMAPGIRLVLRLFDPDFAARASRTLGVHTSHSVSALAAPPFAAAALGRRVETIVAVGRRTLAVAVTRVDEGSLASGRSVAELEAGVTGRVLVIDDAGRAVRPKPDRRLEAGDRLIVVGTGPGLARLVAAVEAGTAAMAT